MRRAIGALALVWMVSASFAQPSDREALHRINNRGVALLEQFRFADAAAEFRRALTSDSAFPAAAVNLAVALMYSPDLPAAETAARAAAALAGATPYLRLFGEAAGGCLLAEEALAALRLADDSSGSRIALARFFAEHSAVHAPGLERAVVEGAESVHRADAALAD